MASKRRNMFHKNKTQETTEEALCVVFQNGDIESNYQVGHGKDQLTCKSGQQSLASLRSYLSFVAKFLILTVILVAFIALVWHFMGLVFVIQLILVALVAYLAAGGGYRWFYVALVTVPRDLKALINYLAFLWSVRKLSKKNMNVGRIFREHALKAPDKPCLVFEDKEWTRAEVEEYSNRVANLFLSHGYRKGDTVALMMENRAEFVCIWLGLSKIGAVTALINYNLRQNSLLHSINVAKAQAFIFGDELTDAVKEISGSLDGVRLYSFSAGEPRYPHVEIGERQLKPLLAETSSSPPEVDDIGFHDRLLYIYTSGTTGLPKAAVITHSRYVFLAGAIKYQVGFKTTDRFYTPLPLYHTAGGGMSIGQAILYGSTVVIRKKFSASAYFSDIVKYNCTVSQYIGEMCRYLLATPLKPEDTQHKLRMVFGNGLRPQIWDEFVTRFNIPKVAEFYGATEGNANIVNPDNTKGAIGFVSRIIPTVYPISVIKVDPVSGDPIRDVHGLCIICKPGEPGVFIGKINPKNPARAFLGYVNEKESEKKIVRDVFVKGDAAFHSGDIVIADEFGYLYFKDRTGDTYRWKGENVSTSEVEGIVSNIINYRDCVVYGVEVPGTEGRAGMAAIVDKTNTLNINVLSEGLKKALPAYARPAFIRVLRDVEMTGTYKMKKLDLQREGFDPSKIKDKLYYTASNGAYEPLTPEIYSQIETFKIRL